MKQPSFMITMALAMLAFIVTNNAQAQIDMSKVVEPPKSPSVKYKGIDPDNLPKTNARLRIAGAGRPAVLSTDHVMVQGRGRVERVELGYYISVRNPGEATQSYRIVSEVLGASRSHRSSVYIVGGGQTQRKRLEFSTDFRLASGSTDLPIVIILQNSTGHELDRVERRLGMQRALTELRGPLEADSDLAVTDLALRIDLPKDYVAVPAGLGAIAISGPTPGVTRATVTIRNAGTERWGYHASITVSIAGGRPGRLTPLTGVSGVTKPLRGGLQPGDSNMIALEIPRAMNPGFYYTATVRLASRDDAIATNDELTYVFFVEENGRVTSI